MHKNNEWFGWLILALALLALGLFLEKLQGESVKEMQSSVGFTKPDSWYGAYQCQCRPFKWLDKETKEVVWTIQGRVLYNGKKTWHVTIKTWKNAKSPDQIYLYMARLVCRNWIHFIVSEYNEDINKVDIADLKRG